VPAYRVQPPIDDNDISSPVITDVGAGTSTHASADASVAIVTVSSQSLPTPNPSQTTAEPDQAELAEPFFASMAADQSDSAPWTGARLWDAADALSKSLHQGDELS